MPRKRAVRRIAAQTAGGAAMRVLQATEKLPPGPWVGVARVEVEGRIDAG